MPTLVVGVGFAIVVAAALVLSPYWWPPVRREFLGQVAAWAEFRASLPLRRGRAGAHWRGLRRERRLFAVLFGLSLCGGVWLIWANGSVGRIADGTTVFKFLFMAIAAASFLGGLGAFAYAAIILDWVWDGFWGSATTVPAFNPLNRVGIADPLGEAGFANAPDTDAALRGGGGNLQPPRFRD